MLLLTYVRGHAPGKRHQSAHTLWAYKMQPTPVRKCADDLVAVVAAATRLHARCIAAAYGPSTAITFIPSSRFPDRRHPVANLARHVHIVAGAERFALGLGRGIDVPGRTVRSDRFVVPDQFMDRVQGRHIMVVDDTWTSGAKVQSAAVTLHEAGAARVTALVVGRWCDYTRSEHKTMLDSHTEAYDALVCPVSGEACTEAAV